MAKKNSTRKISLEAGGALTEFFSGLTDEQNQDLHKLLNSKGITAKINGVGMLVLKLPSEDSKRIHDNFFKINQSKVKLTFEDIEKAISDNLLEEVESDSSWDAITLKQAKSGYFSTIKPKTEKQQDAINCILNKKVSLLMGSAGVGKSVVALAVGLKLLEQKRISKIIITRPPIDAGPSIGFLPGPQPLDAKVLTPNGWCKMGDLNVGDDVIARDGSPSKIIEIFEKGIKPIYRITTTEGSSTECSEDHLWITKTAEEKKRKKDGKLRTTLEIKSSIESNLPGKKINSHFPRYGDIRPNHFLPRNNVVCFEEKNLPIPPYVLGCILGDGSISHYIYISNTDKDLIENIKLDLLNYGLDYTLTKGKNNIAHTFRGNHYNSKTAKKVLILNNVTNLNKVYNSIGLAAIDLKVNHSTLNDRCLHNRTIDNVSYKFLDKDSRWTNKIKNIIFNLGLEKTKATTKFIPDLYKYCSKEDRLLLLQGLMDTDGTIKKNGESSFCTTSKKMALDLIEIVRSLGGRAVLRSRNRVGKSTIYNGRSIVTKNISYEFTISLPNNLNPFRIPRKASRFKSRNNFHDEGITSVEYVGEKLTRCILIDNKEHLYITDDYIVTHNTEDDKLAPYILSVMSLLTELVGAEKRDKLLKDGSIEVQNLGYLRGMTLGSSKRSGVMFLLDEAQNVSFSEHKMILSRLGDHPESRMVYCGDQLQSDLKYKKDTLSLIHSIIKDSPYVGSVVFTREDIVRSPTVKDLMERIETWEESISNEKNLKGFK